MTTKKKSDTVTMPRWLYDKMVKDSELVQHLAHYRGYGWIEAVRKEMELDRKYKDGMFRKTEREGRNAQAFGFGQDRVEKARSSFMATHRSHLFREVRDRTVAVDSSAIRTGRSFLSYGVARPKAGAN